MPRALDFKIGKEAFSGFLEKVDRTKLYGSVELQTLDPDGNECRLLTLAPDGKTIIPTGGTGFGYLSPDGEWREKASLKPTGPGGEELVPAESNFNFENVLKEVASAEDLLDHIVRLVYRLDPVGGEFPKSLLTELGKGTIYRFSFSYRGGIGNDVAFLLQGADGSIWLLIGTPTEMRWLGLEQPGGDAEAAAEESTGADDGIDFEMF